MAIAAWARVCAKNVAGNLKMWIAEPANVTVVTITSGEVSAITGTAAFHRVQADLDQLEREETVEGGPSGFKFTHGLKAKFAKPSKALKTFIESVEAATPCGMLIIVLDGNGQAWLMGYNATDAKDRGMKLIKGALKSGKAPGDGDSQAWDLEFQSLMSEHCLPFDATNNGTITGETATYLSAS